LNQTKLLRREANVRQGNILPPTVDEVERSRLHATPDPASAVRTAIATNGTHANRHSRRPANATTVAAADSLMARDHSGRERMGASRSREPSEAIRKQSPAIPITDLGASPFDWEHFRTLAVSGFASPLRSY
jgi:hypothetical protein